MAHVAYAPRLPPSHVACVVPPQPPVPVPVSSHPSISTAPSTSPVSLFSSVSTSAAMCPASDPSPSTTVPDADDVFRKLLSLRISPSNNTNSNDSNNINNTNNNIDKNNINNIDNNNNNNNINNNNKTTPNNNNNNNNNINSNVNNDSNNISNSNSNTNSKSSAPTDNINGPEPPCSSPLRPSSPLTTPSPNQQQQQQKPNGSSSSTAAQQDFSLASKSSLHSFGIELESTAAPSPLPAPPAPSPRTSHTFLPTSSPTSTPADHQSVDISIDATATTTSNHTDTNIISSSFPPHQLPFLHSPPEVSSLLYASHMPIFALGDGIPPPLPPPGSSFDSLQPHLSPTSIAAGTSALHASSGSTTVTDLAPHVSTPNSSTVPPPHQSLDNNTSSALLSTTDPSVTSNGTTSVVNGTTSSSSPTATKNANANANANGNTNSNGNANNGGSGNGTARIKNDLYKTEICRSFAENGGYCKYGAKCQFAHGEEELRPVRRHPRYKTKLCRNFSVTGSCPYEQRCRFIHAPTDFAAAVAAAAIGAVSSPPQLPPPPPPPGAPPAIMPPHPHAPAVGTENLPVVAQAHMHLQAVLGQTPHPQPIRPMATQMGKFHHHYHPGDAQFNNNSPTSYNGHLENGVLHPTSSIPCSSSPSTLVNDHHDSNNNLNASSYHDGNVSNNHNNGFSSSLMGMSSLLTANGAGENSNGSGSSPNKAVNWDSFTSVSAATAFDLSADFQAPPSASLSALDSTDDPGVNNSNDAGNSGTSGSNKNDHNNMNSLNTNGSATNNTTTSTNSSNAGLFLPNGSAGDMGSSNGGMVHGFGSGAPGTDYSSAFSATVPGENTPTGSVGGGNANDGCTTGANTATAVSVSGNDGNNGVVSNHHQFGIGELDDVVNSSGNGIVDGSDLFEQLSLIRQQHQDSVNNHHNNIKSSTTSTTTTSTTTSATSATPNTNGTPTRGPASHAMMMTGTRSRLPVFRNMGTGQE